MVDPALLAALPTSRQGESNDALRSLDTSEFLDLLIVELKNQDPLNPMENSEILQQMSQIHQIDSTVRLTKTLDELVMGQRLSSASGLIGKRIRGLTSGGAEITGVVDRVSIESSVARLHVGDSRIDLDNVREVLPKEDERTGLMGFLS